MKPSQHSMKEALAGHNLSLQESGQLGFLIGYVRCLLD